MLSLNWIKLKNGTGWCPFHTVNLSNVTATGVYIIWHAGHPGRVVYVGQGDITARLLAHRNRSDISNYERNGALYVTWASVSANQMDGVERYLADAWSPLIGEAYPQATPIAVNSPW
jgi:hypothetical protein